MLLAFGESSQYLCFFVDASDPEAKRFIKGAIGS